MSKEENEFPAGVTSLRTPEQKVFDGQPFPLILVPDSDHQDRDVAYWHNWAVENLTSLKALLLKYGAVLFRQFPFDEPVDFDKFAKSFGWEEFPYVGGVSVREAIVGNVYTSTESPPECIISFHHEMAHVLDHPKILFFYCDIAPPEGGETPIILSHIIHRLMLEREPEFVARLAAEGLRYVRVAPEENDVTSALGRGWKSTFFAKTREEGERNAIEKGFDIEWLENNDMKTTTRVLPAIRYNKESNRTIWFNSSLVCYQSWTDARNERTKSVIFPNGDCMPEGAMKTLAQVVEEAGVAFRWQKGDAVVIDNLQVLHGRSHFTPPRRILASLFKNPNYSLSLNLPPQVQAQSR